MSNHKNPYLDLVRADISCTVYDIFLELLSESNLSEERKQEYADRFDRYTRLQQLYTEAIDAGWDDKPFDWKKAHDLGWTCRRDYDMFAEELKGLDPDEYCNKTRKEREEKRLGIG